MSIETHTDEEKVFLGMCMNHDLTHSMSDDHSYWLTGTAQLRRIRAAATELGMERATEIWNAVVDKKMMESAREMFYWKVKP